VGRRVGRILCSHKEEEQFARSRRGNEDCPWEYGQRDKKKYQGARDVSHLCWSGVLMAKPEYKDYQGGEANLELERCLKSECTHEPRHEWIPFRNAKCLNS